MEKEKQKLTQLYTDTDLGKDYLINTNIPKLFPEQISKVTKENIGQTEVETFDADLAREDIKKNEDKRIITIDLGGNKVSKIEFVVKNGKLVADETKTKTVKKKDKGSNYMAFFEEIAEEAKKNDLDVAISFAGPLKTEKNTIPKGIYNLIEAIIEFVLNEIEKVTEDKKKARAFLPLVATIFFFVLF
jgi:hypothetical protein